MKQIHECRETELNLELVAQLIPVGLDLVKENFM